MKTDGGMTQIPAVKRVRKSSDKRLSCGYGSDIMENVKYSDALWVQERMVWNEFCNQSEQGMD